MGARGPAPRSRAAKSAAKRAYRMGLPAAAAHLGDAARREWDRLVPELEAAGVLALVDGDVIADYCQVRVLLVLAQREIDRLGLMVEEPIQNARGETIGTKTLPNPAVRLHRDYQAVALQLMAKLGLSPIDRLRLLNEQAGGVPAARNRLVELLSGQAANREKSAAGRPDLRTG